MNKRPDKPPVFAPRPANDNLSGDGGTGHDHASAAAPCESRTTPEATHPSVLALAAILGRQSARKWMRDADNDNEPEEREQREDTEP
jgi:hypothetical protein